MTLLFKYHFGDFAFSVFCNLFASFVLIIILLTLFTPKIIISPFIIGQIENGIKKFKFKIINPTPFTYKDVKFSLHLLRRFPDSEHNLRTKIEALKLTVESIPPLKLTVESIPVFPGRRLPFSSRFSPNAIQISTQHDIEHILSDPYSSIELRIDLTHSLNLSSTPQKIFVMNFVDISCIRMGQEFIFGNSIDTTQAAYP